MANVTKEVVAPNTTPAGVVRTSGYRDTAREVPKHLEIEAPHAIHRSPAYQQGSAAQLAYSHNATRWIEAVAAVFCLALCWRAVSWAMQPGLFMMLDEISNLHHFLNGVSWSGITLLPQFAYNDRPVGFILERWLFDAFGFDYGPQVVGMLLVHLANLVLAFSIFKRLGVSVLLSVTGLCVFGTLSTTAETVTYIGAIFDVLCLFFILASIVAFMSQKRGAALLSAILFFLALRTKEFAIVLPLVLLGMLYCASPIPRPTQVLKRLWIQLAIWAIFLYKYAVLIHRMIPATAPGNPYRIHANFKTVITSLTYYIALIFHADAPRQKSIILIFTVAIAVYALWRRNRWTLWALAAFVLTILPVSIIPGVRYPFYVYAPQLFLLLAFALTIDDALKLSINDARNRWVAATAIAALILTSVVSFQRSPYFTNRVNWAVGVRKISAVTANDASKLFSGIAPDSMLFISSGKDAPWLLLPGPCDFLNVPRRSLSFTCVLGGPDDIHKQYDAHRGPKHFLTYDSDGSLHMPEVASALTSWSIY